MEKKNDFMESLNFKIVSSILASLLTFVAMIPYIFSILNNKTKPHIFSWIIWGLTTLIVFFAQLKENGGLGAYPIGLSALITIFIAFLAYFKKSDNSINKLDYLFFLLSISSLPIWYFTEKPIYAVCILTFADIIGFFPTFRKAYFLPFEEDVTFFSIFIFRNTLSVLALENRNMTTVFFPISIAIACLMLVLMILFRRKQLQNIVPK